MPKKRLGSKYATTDISLARRPTPYQDSGLAAGSAPKAGGEKETGDWEKEIKDTTPLQLLQHEGHKLKKARDKKRS